MWVLTSQDSYYKSNFWRTDHMLKLTESLLPEADSDNQN